MFISNLIYRVYVIRNSKVRKFLRTLVLRLEGGDFYSQTLRKICVDYHDIEVGLYSYGGCFNLENIPEGTRIGRYGSFASFKVYTRNHPMHYFSTHPFFFNTKLGYIKTEKFPHTKLNIGNDVWIGDQTLITPNVSKIGNGAVIGAGSVVTEDVPPYAIIAGNPGKLIRYRFNKDVIDKLEASAWWEKDISEVFYQFKEFILT